MLRADSVEIVPFAFPYSPADSALLDLALDRFAAALGATRQEAEDWKAPLDRARSLAHRMDELNWRENRATGAEQHLWTISCSDFFGDPERYAARASERIAECAARAPDERSIRLGASWASRRSATGFSSCSNRTARAWSSTKSRASSPCRGPTRSLVEQYSRYTYPYDIFHRLADIREQLALRRVQGVIHYVQSFCFRQVQDALVRRELRLPILTLECDRPGPPDMRTQTRIEAFLEMLRG